MHWKDGQRSIRGTAIPNQRALFYEATRRDMDSNGISRHRRVIRKSATNNYLYLFADRNLDEGVFARWQICNFSTTPRARESEQVLATIPWGVTAL